MTDPTTVPFQPVIRTQADLERAWRTLMEPLGFSSSSVWLMLIGADDRPLPHITEIDDAADPPSPEQAEGLASMLQTLLDDVAPGGRWAFLRSRPGRAGITEVDRAVAQAMLGACHAAGVPVDVMHLATDDDLRPLVADDLAA
jgi:hypothetical protein